MSEGTVEGVGARLTVVQSIYYQSPGMDPDQRESRYDVEIQNDEQPYFRYLTLKPMSVNDVDTGWIKDPLLVLIDNLEGRFIQTNPSKEEVKALTEKVIEILVGDASFLVPAKDCQRLVMSPGTIKKLTLVNSSSEEIKYSLTAYPR